MSARLACVMHTASVHPEPGSNSHIKVCLTYASCFLAFLLLFLLFEFFRVESITSDSFFGCQYYSVFNVQSMNFLCIFTVYLLQKNSFFYHLSSCDNEIYLTTSPLSCQHFFCFFYFLFFSFLPSFSCLSRGTFSILPLSFTSVNTFFKKLL